MESTNTDEHIRASLIWLTRILREVQAPYQIVGGLAARIHGAKRPIVDIDMYLPAASATILASQLQGYVTKPLRRYMEEVWDLEYFQIKYRGQKIEFGLSPGAKFLDRSSNTWCKQDIDFSKSERAMFNGVEIWVMPKEDLINYKQLLLRDVDKLDIDEMQRT